MNKAKKIAFIVLVYEYRDKIAILIKSLLYFGHVVVVNLDYKVSAHEAELFFNIISEKNNERLIILRHNIEWGDWSMVSATLSCINRVKYFSDISHILMMSDSDCLIKPLSELEKFLQNNLSVNFIECIDPLIDQWVVRGIVHERYLHYHFINWKKHKQLLPISTWIQRKLRVSRTIPRNLKIYFGSQWWCLTFKLALEILKLSVNKDIINYFKFSWIPDEMYFQTLAASVVDPNLFCKPLTFYQFDSSGKPVVFTDLDFDFIMSRDNFLARKIAQDSKFINSYHVPRYY